MASYFFMVINRCHCIVIFRSSDGRVSSVEAALNLDNKVGCYCCSSAGSFILQSVNLYAWDA